MYMYRDKHTKNHDNTNNNDNNHNNNVILPYFLQICGVVCVKLISVSSSNRKYQSFPLLSYFFHECAPEVVVPSYGVDFLYISQPLPWASVHWLLQCTLECHCNAIGWLSVHWDTNGRPSKYLLGTLEHYWKNLFESGWHWDATGETLTIEAYTGTPLEGL